MGRRSSVSIGRGVGHQAAHRPTSVPEVEYEEEDGGHGDVESVSEGWDIFGLEEGMRRQATIGGSSRGGNRVYVLGFQPSRSAIHWELRKRPPDASGSGGTGQRVKLSNLFLGFSGAQRRRKEIVVDIGAELRDRVSLRGGRLEPEEELSQCQWRDGALWREGVLRVRWTEYAREHEVPGERRPNPSGILWQGSRSTGTSFSLVRRTRTTASSTPELRRKR